MPLSEMDTQASRGLMSATLTAADGRAVTLRAAAAQWALSVAMSIGLPVQGAFEAREGGMDLVFRPIV